MFAIVAADFNDSDITAPLERVGEREWSRSDGGKDCRAQIEGFTYQIAKNGRSEFHRPDFVDHNNLVSTNGSANSVDSDRFQTAQIETILSNALRSFVSHMRKHSLFLVERDDLESNTLTAFTDFLGVKTARRPRELLHDALDQRRLSGSRPTSEQNFFRHDVFQYHYLLTPAFRPVLRACNNLAVLTASV